MPVYSAFRRRSEPALAIPEKFSWAAFLLPPVFALYHGLWLFLVGIVLAVVALCLAASAIGDAAAFWLYVLLALWCGFAAPDIRRSALSKNWREELPVIAPDADSAEWRLLQRSARP